MPTTENQQNSNTSNPQQQQDYESLVRKVEEKVWRLWLEELRRENERRKGYRS